MAYHFENIKLEKGMYGRSSRSFSQALEELDPSENYRGTPLEGMDAFQRQLKRFDIRVKGAGSDMVEKFFHTTDSAVLFPEFVSRVVRQGLEEESILPDITATVTSFDGMDYRSIASVPTEEEKALRRVEEGAAIPETTIRTQENLVRLHKRGRMLVASYEAIRFQRLDLFSVTLRQIGAYIGRMHLQDAVDVITNGDGNDNAAEVFTVGTPPISGSAKTLDYGALLDFWSQFDPYTMNTMLVGSDVMLAMLKLPEFRDADKAHQLMSFLSDSKENLPVPDEGPMKILIGPENVSEALQDTSVVVASYDIGNDMRGLIGVVGPTRMDYGTVAARLSGFAEGLTRLFGKQELPPKEDAKE